MFKTLLRKFGPNPFEKELKKLKNQSNPNVLLAWNRGLGDIALALYAMVYRIRKRFPNARITFLIRDNLEEGFQLLEGISTLVAPDWRRGKPYDVEKTLVKLNRSPDEFDVIFPWPEAFWVQWQKGRLIPKLKAKKLPSVEKFSLDPSLQYVGVQVSAETSYGEWRNWPLNRWLELFSILEEKKNVRFLLFGYGSIPKIERPNVVDLRSKTNLLELIALIKMFCTDLVLPDSGILSMAYYFDASFPLHIISLWGAKNHGILKQNVCSANPKLLHTPLYKEYKNVASIPARMVAKSLVLQK